MREATSGREDLDLRPVAAATALRLFCPTHPFLVWSCNIQLSAAALEAALMEQEQHYPGSAVLL
jgi:hypothetical protein